MSRYRPPTPRGAPYITREGHAALERELKYLWKEKRPDATARVTAAAQLGDRSENAEYIYGKKLLAEIDRRVRYLAKRLDELIIVDRPPEDESRVFFGATVTLEDADGEVIYRIVGPDEFDREPHFVSIDSPLAKGLLGKSVGTGVSVPLEGGRRDVTIVSILYRQVSGSLP